MRVKFNKSSDNSDITTSTCDINHATS